MAAITKGLLLEAYTQYVRDIVPTLSNRNIYISSLLVYPILELGSLYGAGLLRLVLSESSEL
jgi:hypothetical protein